ncbi:MAG: hypothetical protein AB7L84_14060 [Acidimicrobiia bacterium]
MRRGGGAALVALLLVAVLGAAPPAAGQVAEGLRVESVTTYVADPRGGTVEVRARYTLTNQTPDQPTATGVRQFYFDQLLVPVLVEAVDLRASSAGRPLRVARRGGPGDLVVPGVVDLEPNLFYGETQVVEVSYVLPAQPPRSEGFSRVNPAFATFPVIVVGDPGLADVVVEVPAGFEVEVVGADLVRTDTPTGVRLEARAIAAPSEFSADVALRDDAALVATTVDVAGRPVTVRAWPGDEVWADYIADVTGRGAPFLAELVGLPWPDEGELEILETSSPYLYGYAGWYRPVEGIIEVGDALDGKVLLHELSHLWFNDDLFDSRWANEGFAEVASAEVRRRLGEQVEAAGPPAPDDPGRLALEAWADPDLDGERVAEQERYGYAASYWVVASIFSEIGPDRWRDVIGAAAAHRSAYAVEGRPLEVERTGWTALLDLFEVVGGSATAPSLFESLVVTDADRPLLAERAAARARYAALVEAGQGWVAPQVVRRHMADWAFAEATTAVAGSHEVLAVRDEIAAVLGRLEGVSAGVPDPLRVTYEEARDVAQAREAADEALLAAQALLAADEARADADGPLAALGLAFGDADGDLDGAVALFEGGDYARAAARAEDARAAYQGAARAGAVRAGSGLLVVLVVAGAVAWRLRSRRRVGGPPPTPGPSGPPHAGGPGEGLRSADGHRA